MPIIFRIMAVFLGVIIVYAAPMSIYVDIFLGDANLLFLVKMHIVFIGGVLLLYSGFRGVNLFSWEKD